MEEKQAFTTFDSISVLGLLSGVIVLTAYLLSNSLFEKKELRAKVRTEQLALQIMASGENGLQIVAQPKNSKDRLPASQATTTKVDIRPEGRIGMDPWGVPYYYRVFQDTVGKSTVIVMSSGPNRMREIIEESFSLDPNGRFQGLDLKGDDIASTTPLSESNWNKLDVKSSESL